MQVLFADSVPDRTVDALESRGHAVAVEPSLGAGDLAGRIAGVEVLVVRSTKVRAEVFTAADRLALVVRAGAGTNTIDTTSAASHGVLVSNVPGQNAAAVAELTLGLILAVDRRIPDAVADLRRGRWEKKAYGKADGLLGSTLGIVGLGSIGMCVAARAAAFGIHVQAVGRAGRRPDVLAKAEEIGIGFCATLPDLVESSDIVSLHVPANPDTRHLVDEAFLARMRPGAILVNTSRGDVVDEDALLRALDAGAVRAGLDVYADEPGSGSADWSSRLAQHPAAVGTHHIGASTRQAQQAIADGVVEIIDAFATGVARNCVNLAPGRLGSATLSIRHVDRVGVLARVLDLLSDADLNVEHMENRVFDGREAAIATIDVAGDVPAMLLDDLGAIPHVLGVSAATLPSETT